MRLISFKVENYKSLKKIELQGLSDRTVFVGRNDSGKSNVLRALDFFFNWQLSRDFQETARKDTIGSTLTQQDSFIFNLPLWFTDYRMFYERTRPVVFEGTMTLEPGDNVLPNVMYFEGTNQGPYPTDQIHSLTITESLRPGPSGSYNVTVDEIKGPDILLLGPSSDGQKVLILNDKSKYEFAILQPTSSQFLNDKVLAYRVLKQHIRGRFVLIPALRQLSGESRTKEPATPDGRHMAPEFLRFEKDVGLAMQDTYQRICDDVRAIFPEYAKIESMESNEEIEVYFSKFASASVGEGVKKHFMLSFDLETKPSHTVGIEEPEIHLHPSKQRELYDFIVEHSTGQVFMTTHSPVIASKSRFSDLFLVTIDDSKITKVERVTENTVGEVIRELGVKQSDFFESDSVVFVEGVADVAVFRAIFPKLSSGLKALFLDTEGWTNMQYYANAKILESQKVQVPVFAIFDGDTENKPRNEKVKAALLSRLHIASDHIVTLTKNSIEDYLLVPRAIKRGIPRLTATEEDIAEFITANSARKTKKKVLDDMFRQYGETKYRESVHAGQIADAIDKSDIDAELRNVIEKISASK